MATVYFLIFVGVCAFVVVWAARKPKAKSDLAPTPSKDLLTTPADDQLTRKNEIWKTRRKYAEMDLIETSRFVPKSAKTNDPEYDGYSRRARHHLERGGHVKDEVHADDIRVYE